MSVVSSHALWWLAHAEVLYTRPQSHAAPPGGGKGRVMRTPSSNWFLTLITVLCLASVLIQGCGAKQRDVEGGEVGSVGLAVDAGGVNLFEMYYDITGPHSYHRDAYVDISNSGRIA